MPFSQVIGQEAPKRYLVRSVNESKVSHAQLFLGPEGSGNLALALAFAQFVNCENRSTDDSCGVCPSCLKAQKFIHPDIHFSFPFVRTAQKKLSTDYLPEWRKALEENTYLGYNGWIQSIDAENKQGNINIHECHDIIRRLNLKTFEY